MAPFDSCRLGVSFQTKNECCIQFPTLASTATTHTSHYVVSFNYNISTFYTFFPPNIFCQKCMFLQNVSLLDHLGGHLLIVRPVMPLIRHLTALGTAARRSEHWN